MDSQFKPIIKSDYFNEKVIKSDTETKHQYLATILVSLGAVCAGTAMAWTSPVLPQIQISTKNAFVPNENDTASKKLADASEEMQLTESQGSLVGAMLGIGALCSAILAGYLADKIGRRKANLILAGAFLINWMLIVFASGPFMLYVARFFAGAATGAICVTAPMYIGEIAEVSIRGTLGAFFQMFMCFGIFLTCAIGALCNWMVLSWILMLVPILFAVSFSFMPETPVYLVKLGETARAEQSLKFFRGKSYNAGAELKMIQADIADAEQKNCGIKDLVGSAGNRKALGSVIGLMMFQQLSGINAVVFYTVPIFNSAGSGLAPEVAAIIISIVQFVVAYMGSMIIDKANRRFYLMTSSIGMMICLAALGLYFHLKEIQIYFTGIEVLPVVSLILFIVAFSLGFGPVPWMVMGEVLAPEIKGIASGLAVMCNWTFVFLVTFSFPLMSSSFGGHVTFYCFGVLMFLCTAFVYFLCQKREEKRYKKFKRF